MRTLDGRWLAYITTERWHLVDIFIVEVDGGAKFNLTSRYQAFDIEPAWQPVCHGAGTKAGEVLRGTFVDELICGHGGADTVIGGAGRDRLFGGVGNDRVLAVDRTFDIVGCGAGKDSVVADRRTWSASTASASFGADLRFGPADGLPQRGQLLFESRDATLEDVDAIVVAARLGAGVTWCEVGCPSDPPLPRSCA